MFGQTPLAAVNTFAAHLDRHLGTAGRPGIPRLVDGRWERDPVGERWRFTTRQFRRTLAWFIARRPYG